MQTKSRLIPLTLLLVNAACGGPEGLEDDQQATAESAATFQAPAKICKHTGMKGPCFNIFSSQLSLSGKKWSDGTWMNDSMTSLQVKAGWEVSVCQHANYGGACFTKGANKPGYYYSYKNSWFDDRLTSIEVRKVKGLWSSYQYESNYPHEEETVWSEEAQGFTHSGAYWYVSNKTNIRKYHVSQHISSSSPKKKIGLPGSCKHFGDLDYYAGRVYAPLEDCPGSKERIYVYDTSLNVVRFAYLKNQKKVGWVAINPNNGLMYTSESETNKVHVYNRNFAYGATISPLYTITLDRTLKWIQGGVFSMSGRLYLATAKGQAGIHVFDLKAKTGTRARYIGPNGYKPGFPNYEEVEGLTLWNLDGGQSPNTSGHIHWILLDNDSDKDDIYVKHISVNDPSKL